MSKKPRLDVSPAWFKQNREFQLVFSATICAECSTEETSIIAGDDEDTVIPAVEKSLSDIKETAAYIQFDVLCDVIRRAKRGR